MNYHTTISFTTRINEIVRLDNKLTEILQESKVKSGIITVFVPGSTGALSSIEFESGLLEDFPEAIADLIPKNKEYSHNKLNFDDNAHSHIKSTIIGPSITIPFINQELKLGTWQQIVFLEFDTRPRNRTLEIMIIH